MQQFFLPLYNYKISFPKSVRLVIMKVIVTVAIIIYLTILNLNIGLRKSLPIYNLLIRITIH